MLASLSNIAIYPQSRTFIDSSHKQLYMLFRQVLRLRANNNRLANASSAQESKRNNLQLTVFNQQFYTVFATYVVTERAEIWQHLIICFTGQSTNLVGVLYLNIISNPNNFIKLSLLYRIKCGDDKGKCLTCAPSSCDQLDSDVRVLQHFKSDFLVFVSWF